MSDQTLDDIRRVLHERVEEFITAVRLSVTVAAKQSISDHVQRFLADEVTYDDAMGGSTSLYDYSYL
jgi:hypothetical protein